MKQVLLMIAVVTLVGCGGSKEEKAAKSKAAAEAKKKSTIVEIADPIVEKAIREELKRIGAPPTGELTKADLERVIELSLYNKGLTEIPKGLEKLTQLKMLHLSVNQLTSVEGLEKLTQLKKLHLGDNQLTDVPKGLEKLDQLKKLSLYDNQLTDVKGL